MATINFEERFRIPDGIDSLEDFRRWVRSDEFPERGRIDYIAGTIEVDMQAQAYYSHGGVLGELLRVLTQLIKQEDLGEIYFVDSRIVSIEAELCAEPDIVYLSHETLDSEQAKLVPKANREDDVIEFDGPPDMVAEVVSDSSVNKDMRRLPEAYFTAGIKEFWLIDARGDELRFTIHNRGNTAFEPVAVDTDGFQHSDVFARTFKLTRERNRRGYWKYDLLMN